MTMQLSSQAPESIPVTRRPPKKFVLSACISGAILLGLASLLIAESIKSSPKMRAALVDYIPGAATMALWIYYVQRPKTAIAVRLNAAYLVGLTIALVLIAYAIKNNEITIVLLYWSMAAVATFGLPVFIVLAILFVHQLICVNAAAEVDAVCDLAPEKRTP